MKEYIENWLKLVLLMAVALLCFFWMCSCKTVQGVEREVVKHDSIFIHTVQKDTVKELVYRVDSVFHKETEKIYQRNDSTFVERLIREYMNSQRVDTIFVYKELASEDKQVTQETKNEKVTVEVVRNSRMANVALWWMWISIVVIVGYVAYRIYKRVKI